MLQMQWSKSFCSLLSCKKRIEAPINKIVGADINNSKLQNERSNNLLWFKGKLNKQIFDMLLDCGASTSCIAKRCITSNYYLKNVPKVPYNGPGLVDVNGNRLIAEQIIRLNFTTGVPELSLDVDFVIVDQLPYSCILGMNLLKELNIWGVNNKSSKLFLNSSEVSLLSEPQYNNRVNLIVREKVTLLPGETKIIRTLAVGPAVEANRPVTLSTLCTEGCFEYENRTSIHVLPSLNYVGQDNNRTVPIAVVNASSEQRTIGKGTNIAQSAEDFVEYNSGKESVNTISSDDLHIDPIDIMCKREDYRHLSNQRFLQLKDLLTKFQNVFSVFNDKIGRANNAEFHINTNNVRPISTPLRRVPLHKESIVKELLKRYEELGIIETIDSPFRASTVLVEKKNVGNSAQLTDKYRLCVDFRSLNDEIDDSGWPTPSIEHCLDAAAGSFYLSSLDFNSGYHQIPCTPEAKEALAFSPGFGFSQYTWNVMPQGIKPAANNFQRTMEKTFRGLEQCILPPFYDDVTVKGNDFDTHFHNLESSLKRVQDCGYTLNALKCKFFQTKIKYLGHIIENGTISVDPDRIDIICNFPEPKDVKSLRRFLGMCQFCSRFLPKFHSYLTPLYSLTKKNVPFNWTPECQDAFNYAKSILMRPSVLRLPSTSDTFILETDASDMGIGCVLKGVSPTGEEFNVSYYSAKLTETEAKWNIVRKEAYSIVQGVKKFRHYLIGKKFILKTDNRVLAYLKSTHTSKSRKLLNWALRLSEYNYDIIHIPSSNNQISD